MSGVNTPSLRPERKSMDSRERILTALNHQEPDRVPFDLGGTAQTGMHVLAYAVLRLHLGLPAREVRARQVFDQSAEMHEDVLDLLDVDARHGCVAPPSASAAHCSMRATTGPTTCGSQGNLPISCSMTCTSRLTAQCFEM